MVLCPQQGEQNTAARQFESKGVAVNTASKNLALKSFLRLLKLFLTTQAIKSEAMKASIDLECAPSQTIHIEPYKMLCQGIGSRSGSFTEPGKSFHLT